MRSQRRPQILLAISEFFNSHRIYRRLRLRTDRAFGVRLDLRAAPIQALTALARSSTANWTPRIESFARHSQSLASGDCGNWPILLSKWNLRPQKKGSGRRLPESRQSPSRAEPRIRHPQRNLLTVAARVMGTGQCCTVSERS